LLHTGGAKRNHAPALGLLDGARSFSEVHA
jgi:hypothetical protein